MTENNRIEKESVQMASSAICFTTSANAAASMLTVYSGKEFNYIRDADPRKRR